MIKHRLQYVSGDPAAKKRGSHRQTVTTKSYIRPVQVPVGIQMLISF